MAWTTALTDLRTILSDGPADKLRAFKGIVGGLFDGSNTVFKTVEFRRVTDFTDPTNTKPLGVYLNHELLSPNDFEWDDPATGHFKLNNNKAPGANDTIECSYYTQWFTDDELNNFLTNAANWIDTTSGDVTMLPNGLWPAAKHYAAADAYQKLALRWAEHLSETYRVEDVPSEKRFDIVESYRKAAIDNRKIAVDLRNDFYTRKGRALQPLIGVVGGQFKNVEPNA
jgi:hypothetical protein